MKEHEVNENNSLHAACRDDDALHSGHESEHVKVRAVGERANERTLTQLVRGSATRE